MRIIQVLLLTAMMMAPASLPAQGQESSSPDVSANRDFRGRIVRGPYETNSFGDNIWVGAAGGVNLYESSLTAPQGAGAALDINVGKWLTPCAGIRVGYQGLRASDAAGSFSHNYVHGDFLWNVSDAISGYRKDRRWDFVPFISTGLVRSSDGSAARNSLGVGAGLLNVIRITDLIDLTLEVRQLALCPDFRGGASAGFSGMTSATFGISFNIGKSGFRRCNSTEYESHVGALESARDALARSNDRFRAMNERLIEQNETLRAEAERRSSTAVQNVTLVCPEVLFFAEGEDELSAGELFHLDTYVKNAMDLNRNKIFMVTGYADRKTSSESADQSLAGRRAEYVASILREKYRLPEDRIIVMSAGADDLWGDSSLNRCVVVE